MKTSIEVHVSVVAQSHRLVLLFQAKKRRHTKPFIIIYLFFFFVKAISSVTNEKWKEKEKDLIRRTLYALTEKGIEAKEGLVGSGSGGNSRRISLYFHGAFVTCAAVRISFLFFFFRGL